MDEGLATEGDPKLMHVCLRIGEMMAILYKNKYLRGPAGHPWGSVRPCSRRWDRLAIRRFRAGTRCRESLVSKWLVEITGAGGSLHTRKQLAWIAERVGIVNRERAGLRWPSDTKAGVDHCGIGFC